MCKAPDFLILRVAGAWLLPSLALVPTNPGRALITLVYVATEKPVVSRVMRADCCLSDCWPETHLGCITLQGSFPRSPVVPEYANETPSMFLPQASSRTPQGPNHLLRYKYPLPPPNKRAVFSFLINSNLSVLSCRTYFHSGSSSSGLNLEQLFQ